MIRRLMEGGPAERKLLAMLIVIAEMLVCCTGVGLWAWDEWSRLNVFYIIMLAMVTGVAGLFLVALAKVLTSEEVLN